MGYAARAVHQRCSGALGRRCNTLNTQSPACGTGISTRQTRSKISATTTSPIRAQAAQQPSTDLGEVGARSATGGGIPTGACEHAFGEDRRRAAPKGRAPASWGSPSGEGGIRTGRTTLAKSFFGTRACASTWRKQERIQPRAALRGFPGVHARPAESGTFWATVGHPRSRKTLRGSRRDPVLPRLPCFSPERVRPLARQCPRQLATA